MRSWNLNLTLTNITSEANISKTVFWVSEQQERLFYLTLLERTKSSSRQTAEIRGSRSFGFQHVPTSQLLPQQDSIGHCHQHILTKQNQEEYWIVNSHAKQQVTNKSRTKYSKQNTAYQLLLCLNRSGCKKLEHFVTPSLISMQGFTPSCSPNGSGHQALFPYNPEDGKWDVNLWRIHTIEAFCCSSLQKTTLHSSHTSKKCNRLTSLRNNPYFVDALLPKQLFSKHFCRIQWQHGDNSAVLLIGGKKQGPGGEEGGADLAQARVKPGRATLTGAAPQTTEPGGHPGNHRPSHLQLSPQLLPGHADQQADLQKTRGQRILHGTERHSTRDTGILQQLRPSGPTRSSQLAGRGGARSLTRL